MGLNTKLMGEGKTKRNVRGECKKPKIMKSTIQVSEKKKGTEWNVKMKSFYHEVTDVKAHFQ